VLIVIIIAVVCVLFGVATYFILYQLGVLPGPPGTESRQSWLSSPTVGARTPLQQAQQGGGEFPRGCLIGLLVGAGVWFLLWGLVLIFALRVLSNPYG
jgi:hypothetical protein